MEEVQTKNLKSKVDELYEEKQQEKEKKKRNGKFRMPRKGKVGKRKVRQGFMTVVRIDDNKNINFEKVKPDSGTYRLSTKDYHVTDEDDIFTYKGKPIIFQATKKLNPYNPLRGINETYGQPYLMARMLGDMIKVKSGIKGNWLMWIIGIGVAIFAIQYLIKGGG